MDEMDIIIGSLAGVLTGIFPGIHVNLLLTMFSPSMFLLGVAVSHTFFDFIPSLFLGVPDESSAVASLPGHRLVMKGRGIAAFRAATVSGFISSIVFILFIPVIAMVVRYKVVVFILIALFLLFSISSGRSMLNSVLVASGAVLLFYLFDGYLSTTAMFTAFFSGVFGIPTITHAIISGGKVPPQINESVSMKPKLAMLSGMLGLIAGVLPGVTSSMVGLIGDKLTEMDDMDKVFVLGGINTVYLITTFLAIWLIGKPRSGIAISLSVYGVNLIPALFVSLSISFLLAWFLGPRLARIYSHISGRGMLLFVLLLVSFIVLFNGLNAFLLFLASSSLGLIAYCLGVKRTSTMSFIIFPLILNLV